MFEEEFCYPITQGGYTNASQEQVITAYKCAKLLKDMISPYILRRSKKEFLKTLPKKTENVLFWYASDRFSVLCIRFMYNFSLHF